MKIIAVFTMLALLAPAAFSQARAAQRPAAATPAAKAEAPKLPIRRVILYSNGVAYIERRGTVVGRAEISLPFKQSQVDDVLKSMVVLDLGRGRIGAVSYNSSAPPSARLAEIPFSINAGTDGESGGLAGGLAAVLSQLQGARVAVAANGRSSSGVILTVEERKSQIDSGKPPLVTHALVLASEAGEISSFNLADVRSVRLLDEGARKDIAEFADASASARRRDAKTIVVTSDGEGPRELLVSYTIAAPIWKTTYRTVIDSSGKPFFQGWAIVDNVSDEDWDEVQLSLVSGTPVSFIQPIQQPLYRYRPVVPIPDDLKLSPQAYKADEGELGGIGSGVGSGAAGGAAGPMPSAVTREAPPPPPPPAALRWRGDGGDLIRNASGMAPAGAPVTTTLSDAITGDSGVTAAASGEEIGDLFEYRIEQPVTVKRDRSALIPIIQARLEGERVSVFNPSMQGGRPMSGLRLKNTSSLTLEGGSITVIDGDAYAGESLTERMKPNDQRFVLFALDLGTLVTARTQGDRTPAFLVRAVNGVLQAHYYQAEKKTYTISNQTDRPRVVYVEHPLRDGWVLADGAPQPASRTAAVYRFRQEVAPRSSVELVIPERRALMDTYQISSLTSREVELFVARRYIDDQTRAALDRIVEVKGRIAALDRRLKEAEEEAEEIGKDQARLRENIKALGDTAEARQLIARYVAKAGEQETRLEQLAAERRAAAAERARLQADLEAMVRALTLDRTL